MSEAPGNLGPAQISPAVEAKPEVVYPNVRHRPKNIPFAIAVWLVVYLLPGVLIGQIVSRWLGMLWMLLGAGGMLAFVWKCLFPARLVEGRDGFRLERPDRKRSKVEVEVAYGKVHEARWERTPRTVQHLLGPLVFIEPFWLVQRDGSRTLIISHVGPPIALRDDEIIRLELFAETLRRRGILGLREERRLQPPSFPFGQR